MENTEILQAIADINKFYKFYKGKPHDFGMWKENDRPRSEYRKLSRAAGDGWDIIDLLTDKKNDYKFQVDGEVYQYISRNCVDIWIDNVIKIS